MSANEIFEKRAREQFVDKLDEHFDELIDAEIESRLVLVLQYLNEQFEDPSSEIDVEEIGEALTDIINDGSEESALLIDTLRDMSPSANALLHKYEGILKIDCSLKLNEKAEALKKELYNDLLEKGEDEIEGWSEDFFQNVDVQSEFDDYSYNHPDYDPDGYYGYFEHIHDDWMNSEEYESALQGAVEYWDLDDYDFDKAVMHDGMLDGQEEFFEELFGSLLKDLEEQKTLPAKIQRFKDFSFDISIYVNFEKLKGDYSHEFTYLQSVEVANAVQKEVVGDLNKKLSQILKVGKPQLDLFSEDILDFSVLGILYDINFETVAEFAQTFTTSENLDLSPTNRQVLKRLDPSIRTTLNAVIWCPDLKKMEMNVSFKEKVSTLRFLLQQGVSINLKKLHPLTNVEVVSNILQAPSKFERGVYLSDLTPLDYVEKNEEYIREKNDKDFDIEKFKLLSHKEQVSKIVSKLGAYENTRSYYSRSYDPTFYRTEDLVPLNRIGHFQILRLNRDAQALIIHDYVGLTFSLKTGRLDLPIYDESTNTVLGNKNKVYILGVVGHEFAENCVNSKPSVVTSKLSNKVTVCTMNHVQYLDLQNIKNLNTKTKHLASYFDNSHQALLLRDENKIPCDIVVKEYDDYFDFSSYYHDLQDRYIELRGGVSGGGVQTIILKNKYPLNDSVLFGLYARKSSKYNDPKIYKTSENVNIVHYRKSHAYYASHVTDADVENLKTKLTSIGFGSLFSAQPLEYGGFEPNATTSLRLFSVITKNRVTKWLENEGKSFDIDGENAIDLLEEYLNLPNNNLYRLTNLQKSFRLANERAKAKDAPEYLDFTKLLGMTSASLGKFTLEDPTFAVSHFVGDNSWRTDFQCPIRVDPTYRIAKNTNLMAIANLAIYVPQMFARFREHIEQDNSAINNAPLGVAMDTISGYSVESPHDFLTNPVHGIFTRILEGTSYLGTSSSQYSRNDVFDNDKRRAYLGAFRYIYSFVDFYTKPLALLYNVLLNPSQYQVRSNPYIKGTEALAATYAIKPASNWINVYKDALKVSQKDTSWSHLMDVQTPSVSDVEKELQLWGINATVFEFDELFDKEDKLKFETFMDAASYRGGDILPVDLRDANLHSVMKSSFEILERLKYLSMSEADRSDCMYIDPQGAIDFDRFSRKLNACVYMFALNWTFNVSTILSEQFYESKFFTDYMKGTNPNVKHVADISDFFEYGVFSSGLKKIFENKSVAVADGERAKFCEANYQKNRMPNYPMHYSMKLFPRVKGSTFGSLPHEAQTSESSKERLSLGAYVSMSNFVANSFRHLNRATDTGEFGPAVVHTRLNGIQCEIVQQTGFATRDSDELVGVNVTGDRTEIRDRLRAITRDYNICVGQNEQKYTGNAQRGNAEIFSCFDETMHMFSCIYYENGILDEIKSAQNCVIGATATSGTKLFRYKGSLYAEDIIKNVNFSQVQLVFNFLVYAHCYDSDRYGIDMSNSDFEICATAFLGSFDALCEQRGYRKLDRMPESFKSIFAEAFLAHVGVSTDGKDALSYMEEFYSELDSEYDLEGYLPSLFFTEVLTQMEMMDWASLEELVVSSVKDQNAYFGIIPSRDAAILQGMSSSAKLIALLEDHIDLSSILNQDSITTILAQDTEDEDDSDYGYDDEDEKEESVKVYKLIR